MKTKREMSFYWASLKKKMVKLSGQFIFMTLLIDYIMPDDILNVILQKLMNNNQLENKKKMLYEKSN